MYSAFVSSISVDPFQNSLEEAARLDFKKIDYAEIKLSVLFSSNVVLSDLIALPKCASSVALQGGSPSFGSYNVSNHLVENSIVPPSRVKAPLMQAFLINICH